MFTISVSKAQSIPNPDFENWDNPNGYNVPVDWDNLNSMTAFDGVYTCSKGSPGNPGSSYLKLVSQAVTGMGVMPGIAVSGMLDMSTLKPLSGFAYNQRPTALTGNWQYMAASADDYGFIAVYFTKWDSGMNMRDTIGMGVAELIGHQMTWTNFSIPISFTNSDNPDSCVIILSASGNTPEVYSYLYVDNFGFAGITGIQDLEVTGNFSVYPNPATENLQVDLSGLKSSVEIFEITDLQGKVVWSGRATNSLLQTIPIAQLSTGSYSLKIQTQKGIITQKFVKQ